MDNQVIAVANEAPDLVLSDKSVELIIAEAERRAETLKKVLTVAIKRTNPTDWLDQNGKPYLGGSGCEKVANLFGLKMEGVVSQRDEREDEKGKYYIYTFMARFHWAAGDIECIGCCSSRDKFFAWDKEKKEYKPLYDVDETNIKKAAYTNLTVNGVTRALGIRNLTWDDLELAGMSKDKVAKVEYNKGANSDPANAGLISEAQGKRLYAIAKGAGYDDKGMHEAMMFQFNIESTKKIPWKKYDEVCKWFENNKKVAK